MYYPLGSKLNQNTFHAFIKPTIWQVKAIDIEISRSVVFRLKTLIRSFKAKMIPQSLGLREAKDFAKTRQETSLSTFCHLHALMKRKTILLLTKDGKIKVPHPL